MRPASYVLYTVRCERRLTLCVSEIDGVRRFACAETGRRWWGALEPDEAAEVAAGLERDRAALSGARLEAA